jgi:hypothetical protein
MNLKSIKCSLTMACMVSSVAALSAPLEKALKFYASFDKGVNADQACGQAAAQKFGTIKMAPGARGQAAVFAKAGDYLQFSAAANLNPNQGTIAFYVKDIDATPEQRVWNPYFQWVGQQEAFNILRLWQPLEIAGGLWRNGAKISLASTPLGPQNKWRHLAFVYQRNVIRLYSDGVEVATTYDADFVYTNPGKFFTLGRPSVSRQHADSFHTGSHLLIDAPAKADEMKIGIEPYGAFAIDEFCVFDRPLTKAEVKRLAAEGVSALLNWSSPDELSINMVGSSTLENIRVLLSGCQLRPDSIARVSIRNTAGKILEEAPVTITPSGSNYAYLSTAKLSAGEYAINASAQTDGQEMAAVPLKYRKHEADIWFGNKLGAEDIVLPGLLPLKADEQKVELWGRTYYFNKSLLPQKITNQNKETLSKPISWQATSNRQTRELQFSDVKLVSNSATRAVYEGSGVLGDLQVTGKVTVEYDGFMRFDLTFTPPNGGAKVDKLWMSIPFVKSEASLLFYQASRSAGWRKNWRSAVTPLEEKGIITIGNPDRCLQWMIESDQYWWPEDNPQALQTSQTADSHILDTVVIDKSKQIDKPFTLTYIMQTGPVKPRPANWRGWTDNSRRYLQPGLHNFIKYTYDWWARSPGEPIPADGFPAVPDKSIMKDAIPCVSMHFGGFRETREKTDPEKRTPEWQKYEGEWQRVPKHINSTPFPGWNDQYLDTKAASWGDWHVWCVNELFRTTGTRGLYYDDWLPGSSKNEFAGSGYIGNSGIRRPTRDICNQREFHRRVYALVKHYRPDGIIYLHVSGCPILPLSGFCDIDYDGEVMGWSDRLPPDGRYFDSYRMDIFQILFSTRQFGPVPVFHDITTKMIGSGGSPLTLLKSSQRQLWALLLLHDIHIQDAFTTGMEELRYLWMDAFGIAENDVTFAGYWDNDSGAKLDGFYWPKNERDALSKGYISVYKRPGKALLIIARDAPNNYSGAATAKIKLDRAKLGLPLNKQLRSMDMESMGRTPLGKLDGDLLQVSVECDDFVAVLLEVAE